MVGFVIGVMLGVLLGLGVAWYLCPQEDGEMTDYWARHCMEYQERVREIREEVQKNQKELDKATEDFIKLLDTEIWEA